MLVKLVIKIVPDKNENQKSSSEPRFRFVEEHMLRTPPLAVQQVKNEIIEMADTAMTNFDAACEIVCTLDYKNAEEFRLRENRLNFLNKELVKFIVE